MLRNIYIPSVWRVAYTQGMNRKRPGISKLQFSLVQRVILSDAEVSSRQIIRVDDLDFRLSTGL